MTRRRPHRAAHALPRTTAKRAEPARAAAPAALRIGAIDGLRGLALCLMIVYHFSFDLNWFGFIRADFDHDPFWLGFRGVIVSAFMLLVGQSAAALDALVAELTARGLPPTGTENYGGPIVTAGGIVFIAATKDEMIRAFDQKTGKVLWQTKLPAAGYATPSTYMVNGRQFVVIACGGGKSGTKSGDAYVAFALP